MLHAPFKCVVAEFVFEMELPNMTCTSWKHGHEHGRCLRCVSAGKLSRSQGWTIGLLFFWQHLQMLPLAVVTQLNHDPLQKEQPRTIKKFSTFRDAVMIGDFGVFLAHVTTFISLIFWCQEI